MLGAPTKWAFGLQEAASKAMESITTLHNEMCFYLVIVLILVGWALFVIIIKFTEKKISQKYFAHSSIIEIIWTIIPAIILLIIAIPSFQLLYLLDEDVKPYLAIKVVGYQWYWGYDYASYILVTKDKQVPHINSYMKPEDSLEEGDIRLLTTDNPLLLPTNEPILFAVTAADVIHSFAVPALGIKIDAIPGRLNHVTMTIKQEGTYYGQCSELCGVQHGFYANTYRSSR